MKLLSILSFASLACTSVFAHPVAHGDDSTLDKRQNGIVLTTGPGGDVMTRYEVRQLKANYPNQWTLFILALSQWQKQSQGSATSYFGISSIHGVPLTNYNGVGQCASCSGAFGYCTHDSVLFPAWHRTYVALFEQEFLQVAKSIANSFPASKRQLMVTAANKLRFPYWDWAEVPPDNLPALPYMISDFSVTVDTPTGRRTINNPMFRYEFTDNSGLVYSPFTTWQRTYRYPNNNGVNAASNTGACQAAFANVRQSLQDQVYNLMTQCTAYLEFSNDAAAHSSPGCSNSIESIHNTVHTTSGGFGGNGVSGGHMTYLPEAAFDPIFWLHHANVDRLFAIWQAINPDSYGAGQNAPHNTWTIALNSYQDQNSPLTPFYKDFNGDFWTTNDVRDWANTFRYTYPEFNSGGSRDSIIAAVNRLYGPNAGPNPARNRKREADPQAKSILQGVGAAANDAGSAVNSVANDASSVVSSAANAASSVVSSAANAASSVVSSVAQAASSVASSMGSAASAAASDVLSGDPLKASNGSSYQYAANIQTPKYVLGGSYSIYCFNGNPTSEDPTTWIFDQNLIGPMGIMAAPGMQESTLITSGSIPLTTTLQKIVSTQNSVLPSLAEAVVVPYLHENLKWRIQGPDGNSVEPSTLDGFVVQVVTSTAAISNNEAELPVLSNFVPLVDATKNIAGGANTTITPPSAS